MYCLFLLDWKCYESIYLLPPIVHWSFQYGREELRIHSLLILHAYNNSSVMILNNTKQFNPFSFHLFFFNLKLQQISKKRWASTIREAIYNLRKGNSCVWIENHRYSLKNVTLEWKAFTWWERWNVELSWPFKFLNCHPERNSV